MSTAPQNFLGSKYRTRSGTVRASRMEIFFRGVCLSVDYSIEGDFLAATSIDDKSTPTATIYAVEAGGVDIGPLFGGDFSDIEAALERQLGFV